MSNKIIVAKSGYDARKETDPDNLIFSSDYNTLKYYLAGNTTLTINGNGSMQATRTVVAHNLGYIPFFECFVNNLTNSALYNVVPYNDTTAGITRYASAFADSTNLYLTFKANPPGATNYSLNFYYKIFKNNLGL